MVLHPHDIVGYQGVDYLVEGILDYKLAERVVRLACMTANGQLRFLELPATSLADRLLVLAAIDGLDITTPPPDTIYHRGESYLLRLSGSAQVTIAGNVPDRQPGACMLWRYRAAGGQFLQIERWADAVHMLAGPSVHKAMLEVRPDPLKK
jgi:hypothetical protein